VKKGKLDPNDNHMVIIRILVIIRIKFSFFSHKKNHPQMTSIDKSLYSSIQSNDLYKVCQFIGGDVDTKLSFLLFRAVENTTNDYLVIIRLLLDKGFDINATRTFTREGGQSHKSSLLYFTIIRNSPFETIKLLLERGANPNQLCVSKSETEKYASALHLAIIYKGSFETIKLLLEHGANVNYMSSFRTGTATPMFVARVYKRMDVYKLLVEHGAREQFIKTVVPPPKRIIADKDLPPKKRNRIST
jgi:ankyrin repeat protein